ncbi:GNAT family N-acetyltransferase [Parendozoicomonas haliclonae]|uniref:Putative acetyltransferase n=1 Tax=Parendozoicomonas haliclonae TaxID=1960125 RepID=A0A1X7AIT3_9GAMM|nr:GNAT family N-acetyltransferase [Parendozoicomonas haliclonae]SMA44277.1 putative acetyltransferase [Parendozoicomonas haliclonae]
MSKQELTISPVTDDDFGEIVIMLTKIAHKDILPHFSGKGQEAFAQGIPADTRTAFDRNRFFSVKAVQGKKIVGFAALRDKNYLTHLFVAKSHQKTGLGKQLLHHMLIRTVGETLSLRASVNAVNFYKSQGFLPTDQEQQVKGVRYVPMTCRIPR